VRVPCAVPSNETAQALKTADGDVSRAQPLRSSCLATPSPSVSSRCVLEDSFTCTMALSSVLDECSPASSGGPALVDDETEALCVPGVTLLVGENTQGAAGTVHVTTRCARPAACASLAPALTHALSRRLVWFPASPAGASGCSVGFERIVMHAISRDSATGARPCIFAQVERPPAPGGAAGDEEDAGDDDDEEELLSCTELRLVPSDEAARASLTTTRCTVRTARADAHVCHSRSEQPVPHHVRRGGAESGPSRRRRCVSFTAHLCAIWPHPL
jgi:hypothetical protein